jgi:hypothetical protein
MTASSNLALDVAQAVAGSQFGRERIRKIIRHDVPRMLSVCTLSLMSVLGADCTTQSDINHMDSGRLRPLWLVRPPVEEGAVTDGVALAALSDRVIEALDGGEAAGSGSSTNCQRVRPVGAGNYGRAGI